MTCKELKRALVTLNKIKFSNYNVLKNMVEIDFDNHTLRTQDDIFSVEYHADPDMFLGRKRGVALADILQLKDIVSGSTGEVKFYRKGDNLEIRAGKIRASIPLNIKIPFPMRFLGDIGEKAEKVAFKPLKEFFEKLAACVARDDYRAVLNGIFLDKKNGKGVATDGHRLLATDLLIHPPEDTVLNNPTPILKSINGAEEARVEFFEDSVGFVAGDFVIGCRFMKGEYSPWTRVIPREEDTLSPVHLDIEDLNICKPIVNKTTKQIVVNFLEKGRVLLSGCRSGESESTIESKFRGKCPKLAAIGDFRIGFNLNFFMDLMKSMGGDPDIRLGPDNSTAVTMRNKDGDVGLIMPVRLAKAEVR